MWQLEYPWLLVLWPLAWLAYRCLPAYREPRSAVRIPFFAEVGEAVGLRPQGAGLRRNRGQLLLNVLVWGLLVLALARPVQVEQPLVQRLPVRDLMLAIDLSQSMETRDFTDANGQPSDRLSAVKTAVQGFIQRRPDDRLGLIVFGSAAYPQAPLTLDHESLSRLLAQTRIGMAGPNTALGDAVGLGLKLLGQAHEPHKVLILLTDGNDTSSAITPAHAAAMAAAHGVTVHTIGIGDPNATGEAKVDLATLQQISQATGGQFFRAANSTALNQVYGLLDQLTPHQVEHLSHQPRRDLFQWPLGLALALLLGYHGIAFAASRVNLMRLREAG